VAGQLGLRRVDRDQDRPEPGGDQMRGAGRRVGTCERHDRSLAATASRRYYDRAWLHTVSITMASRFHQGPQDLMIPTMLPAGSWNWASGITFSSRPSGLDDSDHVAG